MKKVFSSYPPEFCDLTFWAADWDESLSDALDDWADCDEGLSEALDDWDELVEDIASTARLGS